MQRLASVCPDCGNVFERDESVKRGSCPDCHDFGQDDNRTFFSRAGKTTTQRGYGARWQRLSRKARQLQPFCSDCGATEDLTGDHTPEAWARYEAGKVLRLKDIDVVCRTCNGERGKARGEENNYWLNRQAGENYG